MREIDPFEWRTLFKATCDDFQHIFAVPFERHLLAVWRIFQFKQRVLADEIFFLPANIEAIAQLKRVDVIVRDLFRHKATTNRTSRLIAVSAQPITVFLHHTIAGVNSWQRRWNPARFQCVGRIGTAAHLHEINANVARRLLNGGLNIVFVVIGSPNLQTWCPGHPVPQRLHFFGTHIDPIHMEERNIRHRATIDFFKNRRRIRTLDLETVMGAQYPLAIRAAVGARIME